MSVEHPLTHPPPAASNLAFSGRRRHKKCDEKVPECGYCARAGRECTWPSSADLLDRRFASHERSRHQIKKASSKHLATRSVAGGGLPLSVPLELRLLTEAGAAHGVISRDLEMVISRHFIERYYGLLLLPNGHPGFYNGWIIEIQELMTRHKSLYYSLLANAASHIHFIDTSSTMQELALTYYSNSLKDLSRLLETAGHELQNHNGILMSVMLLYLHGVCFVYSPSQKLPADRRPFVMLTRACRQCMGRGTYSDIPRHVNAATRILTMRLLEGQIQIKRLFDRLAIESLLYQIFLATTGLWLDPVGLDYEFNAEFWFRAEDLLERSTFFPDQPRSVNSPVLGVPVSLFRLTLSLKQQLQCPFRRDQDTIDQLRGEVEMWEAALLCNRELDVELFPGDAVKNRQQSYYRDALYLFAVIASVMFEQLSLEVDVADGLPMAMPSDCWQVAKAVQILEARRNDDGWASCYMGNWPTYTLGFFMSSAEHIDLIRSELQRRWDLVKFSQVARFRNDLEQTWEARERVKVSAGLHNSLAFRHEKVPVDGRIYTV